MLADPGIDRLVEAVDGLVVQLALRAVGAFDQDHPARQAGGRAAVVQIGQPGAAAEGMAVIAGVVYAAQALEQAVELL
ncbi:hypothetical protein D3C72_2304620 [compost metagenome]